MTRDSNKKPAISVLRTPPPEEDSTIDLVKEFIICPFDPFPQFPGGNDSLKFFIKKNLNWNRGKEMIVGRAYVEFVVDIDGSIADVKIIKGLCDICDKAAVDVVKKLPKFIPAVYPNGRAVKIRMVLPVQFDR